MAITHIDINSHSITWNSFCNQIVAEKVSDEGIPSTVTFLFYLGGFELADGREYCTACLESPGLAMAVIAEVDL